MGRGAADFSSGNVDEDTAADLLADKSRCCTVVHVVHLHRDEMVPFLYV